MIDRPALQSLLRSDPKLSFAADDQSYLCFAERLVEVLGEVTEEMLDEGALPLPLVENECTPTIKNMRDDARMTYTEMWAARFRGE